MCTSILHVYRYSSTGIDRGNAPFTNFAAPFLSHPTAALATGNWQPLSQHSWSQPNPTQPNTTTRVGAQFIKIKNNLNLVKSSVRATSFIATFRHAFMHYSIFMHSLTHHRCCRLPSRAYASSPQFESASVLHFQWRPL